MHITGVYKVVCSNCKINMIKNKSIFSDSDIYTCPECGIEIEIELDYSD